MTTVERQQLPVDNGNDNASQPVDVLQQISELARSHDEVMTVMSSLNTEPTRSYMCTQRKAHSTIVETDKDGWCVDDLVEEVERALSARNIRLRN